MKRIIPIICLFFSFHLMGQTAAFQAGDLQVGTRLDKNLLLPEGYEGFGVGIQAKYFLHQKVSIVAGYDYSVFDLGGVGRYAAQRVDLAVRYYPVVWGQFNPYLTAGLAHQNERVTPASLLYVDRTEDIISGNHYKTRLGLGTNYRMGDGRLNLGLSIQYDLAITDGLRYDLEETDYGYYVNTALDPAVSVDPLKALNIIFSINYKITNFSK